MLWWRSIQFWDFFTGFAGYVSGESEMLAVI